MRGAHGTRFENGPYATVHYLMQSHVGFTASPVLAGVWRAAPLTYGLTVMAVPSPSFAFVLFTVVLKSQVGKQNRCLMRIVPPWRFSSGQIKGSKSLVLL